MKFNTAGIDGSKVFADSNHLEKVLARLLLEKVGQAFGENDPPLQQKQMQIPHM